MVSAVKDPLTFDELMANLIDFSKYAKESTPDRQSYSRNLIRPLYNLLKETCTSSIELEYNMEECFKALTDRLRLNNQKDKLSQMNKFSKHNVYSTNKILSMVSVSVKKLHGYGHLEEIVVRRGDRQKSIIKRRVEDLQLGVESYQKKLNITAPQKTFPEIKFKELYTLSYKPLRVIYEDLNKQKRVMQADELYKCRNPF
ncbi:hypothetical protein Tco_0102716 [Tanacetum coccineum]